MFILIYNILTKQLQIPYGKYCCSILYDYWSKTRKKNYLLQYKIACF